MSGPIGATFPKLAQIFHLDMIYRCHVVVCFLDLHFTLGSPRLGRNGYVYISVPIGATFTLLASSVHIAPSLPVTFRQIPLSGFREVEKVKSLTRQTDDRSVFTIVHMSIRFRCTKKLNKSTSIKYINDSKLKKYIIKHVSVF